MDKLGVNLFSIILYSSFFLILYVVVKIFLVPKIEEALEKRQKEIERGLSLSKDIDVLKEEVEKDRKKVIAEAQKEKQEILDQVQKRANDKSDNLIKEAKEKSHKIINDANELIKQKEKMIELSVDQQVKEKVKEKIISLAEAGKIKVDLDQINSIL